MPEVSVIIPTYNRADFLEQAIRSVLEQTFRDLELIIVDDGSTDDTPQLVKRFKTDPRLRYTYQSNRGDGAARNTGIARGQGQYFAFLDSDDYWLPRKLECQLAALGCKPGSVAVQTAVYVEELDRERRIVSRHIERRKPLRERTPYEQQLYGNIVTGSNSSVVLTRAVLNEVGLFDEDFRSCDRDLWLRIQRHHEFLYLDTPLSVLRKHGSNQWGNLDLMEDEIGRMQRKFAREVPDEYRYHLPRVRLMYCFVLGWAFARQRRWGPAWHHAWQILPAASRCPGFTVRFLGRALQRLFRKATSERLERPAETLPPPPLDPHTQ